MGYEVEVVLELVCDIVKWETIIKKFEWDMTTDECPNNLIEDHDLGDQSIKRETIDEVYREAERIGWYIQKMSYFKPTWGNGYCLCSEHNTPENRKRCKEA